MPRSCVISLDSLAGVFYFRQKENCYEEEISERNLVDFGDKRYGVRIQRTGG